MSACFLITCKYELIVHSKRRAFPSISGGGNRLQAPLKKGKRITDRWKAVFINQQKESETHDFCLFSDAEQDKTLSEEKLALFKGAKLGKRKGFSRHKNENFELCKDVL